jgi:hypothetical protein
MKLNENSIIKMFLLRFSFVCFATVVVQSLPPHGCKKEKNKEKACLLNELECSAI